MAGTTRGARSAFHDDDDGGGGRPKWVPWALGLLALLLVVGFAIGAAATEDDSEDKAAKTTGTTQDQASPAGGGEPTAGRGGTLTAGGRSLLPPEDLKSLVGERAEGRDVTVQSVAGQQGFWVGTSEQDRVFVEFGAKAGVAEEGAAFKPTVGQKVNLSGPIRPAPEEPGRTLRVEREHDLLIKEQGAYINADRVEPA